MMQRLHNFKLVLVVISVFLWGVWGVGAQALDATDAQLTGGMAAMLQANEGAAPAEWLTVALFGVLLAVVGLLVYLLARLIPLLHESVSASNLKPLYDALLPLAKQSGTAAYDTLIAELRAVANKTPNSIDNALLEQLESLVDKIIAAELTRRGGVEDKLPAEKVLSDT